MTDDQALELDCEHDWRADPYRCLTMGEVYVVEVCVTCLAARTVAADPSGKLPPFESNPNAWPKATA